MEVKDLKEGGFYIISEYQINSSEEFDRDIYCIEVIKKTEKATKIRFDIEGDRTWLLNEWDITVIEEIVI